MRFPGRQTLGKGLFLFLFVHFVLIQNEPKDQDLKLLRYKLSPR